MARTMVTTEGGLVFAFDGEVVEVFSYDGSRRVHVAQIDAIDVGAGMLGGSSFSIALKAGQTYAIQARFTDSERSQLEKLVAEVRAAAGV
jgi:hypothetical protein